MTELSDRCLRRLISGALFPLHERLKGHASVAVRRRLERSQWQPPGVIRRTADERLQGFLARAGERVPYYRRLFADAGLDPAAMRGREQLQQLPLLDKATIRAHSAELCADDARGLRPFNTGGSSGEPLIFYLTRERVSHDVAAKWRATRWWGVDIGDTELALWGSPLELGRQDRVKQLRDTLLRTRLLPAFEMSDERMDSYLERIRRRAPRMLFGYPSALSLLAERARRHEVPVGRADRVIFCTGECLEPEQRAELEAVFGGRVANGYGGRDAGFVAHECPAGGLHISAEDIIVELLDGRGEPVRDGQAGEIVITHLATGDYPFIRYRTGDMATRDQSPCACGRGLPKLGPIQGRSTDFIVAADGTRMHGLALIYVLRDQPGVSAFRIEQHSLSHTSVDVVAEDGCDPDLDRIVQQGFRKRLGPEVRVDIRRVGHIRPEASGKYRYVVSHVSP